VAPERNLTDELAEEIRAAVAQASPPPSPPTPPLSPEEEGFRTPLARASEHLTPAIPPAVRLGGAKRLALRLLRFLWRDQASFNALMLEAVGSLANAMNVLRQRLEDSVNAERQERLSRQNEITRGQEEFLKGAERELAEARRRAAIQDGRLAVLEAAGSTPVAVCPPKPPPLLPAGVYSLFEERFRGSPEEIAEKQRSYLPLLKSLPGPVLDVGCGRGELLRLLAAEGIPALGVEINPISASACRTEGLEVEQGEGLAYLASRKDGSLGGVVALQVVEHWTPEATFAFLREARRALAPGGVLIAETINSDSLSALKAFFLDPSHVRPVPPDALRFLAEAAGFIDARIEYRASLPPGERLDETSPNEAKLNRLLFGPQDYALVARVPKSEDGRRETGDGEAP
jgi:2-polyprenyl-3-methyl-5-hydroxy-6-metoxy-1,4-benzoquinol methylase